MKQIFFRKCRYHVYHKINLLFYKKCFGSMLYVQIWTTVTINLNKGPSKEAELIEYCYPEQSSKWIQSLIHSTIIVWVAINMHKITGSQIKRKLDNRNMSAYVLSWPSCHTPKMTHILTSCRHKIVSDMNEMILK